MKSGKNTVNAAQNRVKALELRAEGFTLERIAQELNVSTTMAFKYIKKSLSDLSEREFEEAKQYRSLQMHRLELLLTATWDLAISGDLLAVDKARQLIDQKSKLMNLYAPTRIAQTTADGEDVKQHGIIVVPATANSVEEWLAEHGPKD